MRSSPSGSRVSLVFVLMGDDSVKVKFQCKEVDPLRKQPNCTVHVSPHNSGTVIVENTFNKDHRRSTMGSSIKVVRHP